MIGCLPARPIKAETLTLFRRSPRGKGASSRSHALAITSTPQARRVTLASVRPATAVIVLLLLALILIAGAFQLRAILAG